MRGPLQTQGQKNERKQQGPRQKQQGCEPPTRPQRAQEWMKERKREKEKVERQKLGPQQETAAAKEREEDLHRRMENRH